MKGNQCKETNKGTFNGKEITAEVLNPAGWFGKTWLLEIDGPLFLVVEADNVSDAIDELAENEKYGHEIVVADEDLGDYPEDERRYSGSGQVLDLDHLLIHGPFLCRYFGDGLPVEGVVPTEFEPVEE